MRKYIQLIAMGYKKKLIYNKENILNIFVSVISIFILRMFWKTLYPNDYVQFEYMLNYAIVAEILTIIYNFDAPNRLTNKIRDGGIAVELVKPWTYLISLMFEDFGTIIANLLVRGVPVFLISIFVYDMHIPNLLCGVLFMISIGCAFLILYYVKIMVSMISFWVVEAWSFIFLIDIVIKFFSGQFLPSWIVPKWCESIMYKLPFIWIYQKPIELYLSVDASAVDLCKSYLSIIGIQFLWIIGLSVLSIIVWKRAENKLVVQGG